MTRSKIVYILDYFLPGLTIYTTFLEYLAIISLYASGVRSEEMRGQPFRPPRLLPNTPIIDIALHNTLVGARCVSPTFVPPCSRSILRSFLRVTYTPRSFFLPASVYSGSATVVVEPPLG